MVFLLGEDGGGVCRSRCRNYRDLSDVGCQRVVTVLHLLLLFRAHQFRPAELG